MRILIVEDDRTSLAIMQRLLEVHGSCDSATNGREAVDAFATALRAGKPYDLVCLDVMMPEMDGLEALIQIRKLEAGKGLWNASGAKVLMITARSDVTEIIAGLKLMCEDYLVKPITRERLTEKLRRLGLLQRSAPEIPSYPPLTMR
jgi:two-component system chemotaxis response regulator CheY